MSVIYDPLWVVNDIIKKVSHAIEQDIGDGTPFFDRIDAILSSDYFYEYSARKFMEIAETPVGERSIQIVVSGKWGYGFTAWAAAYADWLPSIHIVSGGLRHNYLPDGNIGVHGDQFLFLDNSAYKGRTRDKIMRRIEESGGQLLATIVLYDGSPKTLDGIEGIFRYHEIK